MEWYVRNVIRELAALDDRHEWVVVTSPENWRVFDVPPPRWTKIAYIGDDADPAWYLARTRRVSPTPWLRLRHALARLRTPGMRRWYGGLNDLVRRERLDLWFCPFMYALPHDVDVPVVNTIPDLQHEHFPDFFGDRELALRTLGYRESCGRAAATIAISEFVAQDLLKRYRLERAVGIPLGLDPAFLADPDETARLVDRVRLKYRLDQPFLYYPANGWRHKDHETLLRAFRLIREQRPDVRLVLTGFPFDVMDRLRPLFESLEESRTVRHLGYVDRRDTIGLYAAASVMVFPSRFEGFGLPLLEAMASGTPIVCSPLASIPEVAGDAALYVDPGEPAALARAALRLLEDEVLRARRVEAGRERVRGFSFTDTARQTLAVFEEVMAGTWRAPDAPAVRPLVDDLALPGWYGRWCFHCGDLREVHLRIAVPACVPQSFGQRLTVSIDDRVMLSTGLEPGREYTFTLTPPSADTDFRRLEVTASVTVRYQDQLASLQVRELTIRDGDGRARRLII